MEILIILVMLGVWLGVAFWASSIATNKGHSGGLWFFLALVFGLFAVLIIAVMGPRRDA